MRKEKRGFKWVSRIRIHRARLYEEQGQRCAYCHERVPYYLFSVDHKIPKSKGGNDEISNLLGACTECNTRKSDMTREAFLQMKFVPVRKEYRLKNPASRDKDWRRRMRDTAHPPLSYFFEGMWKVFKKHMTIEEFSSFCAYADWRPLVVNRLINRICRRLL